MTNKKFDSVIHLDGAYTAFSNRFIEPDNKYAHRNYQLKSFSGNAMPTQIKNINSKFYFYLFYII